MPERTVLRIVSGVWWIAIVVLMNAFAGQMRACLLVKNELQRVGTLADIAARPHLKVYMLKKTIVTNYLEVSEYCTAGNSGQFYFGNEVMYTLMMSAYMSRNLDRNLRQRIKGIVTVMREAGIVNKAYDQVIPPLERCTIVEDEEQLKMQDMASIFVLYGAFTAVSVLVFLAEILVGRFARHRIGYVRRLRRNGSRQLD
ncbi:hypothetical protein HPB49_006453 [Dermacentor silvarum]|uniref:Uncharacterized protein n=1 Tax=Dermacentor silvarum TaxID=543639 RepID=A0ACB8CQC9_DERSI|nr:hypothetical protein HPB49_006453 [Dermacentor silvarum]